MKKLQFCVFFLLLASQLFSSEFIFREDPIYSDIEFLARRNVINIDFSNLPLRSDKVLEAIEEGWFDKINSLDSFSREELFAINSILDRFSLKKDFLIKDNASLTLSHGESLDIQMKNRFYAMKRIPSGIIAFEMITLAPFENTDSTSFRMDEWKKTGSDCQNTYMAFYDDSWSLLAGRMRPAWGQGIRDDIFLSRKILPMDGVFFSFDWERASFSFFAANKKEYHYSDKRSVNNAYLSSHMVSLKLPLETKLSFKEIVLYRSNLPQLYYLNPAMFYYIIQYNSHSDDNIFWSIEASNKTFKKFIFSGEFFIDDFQYDKDYDYVPHKIGVLLNATYSPDMILNPIFYAEYCFLNTYTNTHEYLPLSYSYYNMPMSYMSGTDMDNISFGVITKSFSKLNINLDVSYLRQGDGELDVSWESQMPDSELGFPSGSVDKTISALLLLEYDFFKWGGISMSAKWSLRNGFDDNEEPVVNESKYEITGSIMVKI
ncbi:MAG: hypothetical protein PHW02_00375 [bacterium]|nr:hypothetical protein [bacterium]